MTKNANYLTDSDIERNLRDIYNPADFRYWDAFVAKVCWKIDVAGLNGIAPEDYASTLEAEMPEIVRQFK